MEIIIQILLVGTVATIAIDIWSTFSNKVLNIPRTNWALVGRWLGHIPTGKFVHNSIGASPTIKNELLIGWIFHYFIGITYAALYVAFVYTALNQVPSLLSAWVFGLVTIVSPWFVMQPGLGLGVCATKAPRPNMVRLQNVIIHSIFGIALYYGWLAIDAIF